MPFYLVGSMHSVALRDYPLPQVYRTALTKSQRLVFEHDPRQRPLLIRKFREAARYPAGQTIESEVRPATLALLKKNAWRSRMNFEQMRRFRPWAIALNLLAEEGPIGADNPRSMDSSLSAQARRAGKEVAGLETTDEHVAFWREMLERDGENLLLYTLIRGKAVGALVEETRDRLEKRRRGGIGRIQLPPAAGQPGICAEAARPAQSSLGGADRGGNENAASRPRSWPVRDISSVRTGVVALLEKRGYKIERL